MENDRDRTELLKALCVANPRVRMELDSIQDKLKLMHELMGSSVGKETDIAVERHYRPVTDDEVTSVCVKTLRSGTARFYEPAASFPSPDLITKILLVAG